MQDARGNPTSANSGVALDAAERALWRIVSFFGTPFDDLDAASAADPAWMFPHVARAAFLLTLTEASLKRDVAAALAKARSLGSTVERERAHLAAAERCAAGDWAGAASAWGAIATRHPRDLFALQWASLFDFHRGDAANLLRRPAAALPHWPGDDALRPYLLALHAFGLEEGGRYAEAEAAGREAAAGPAKVPWATHAVAHVMEMQGRHADGRRWLHERAPDWSLQNGFAGHHWWHLGLFHLEAMDLPAALALHDEQLALDDDAITLQRLDGASLLWRLRLLGADVAARCAALADGWDARPDHVGHSAFNDAHAAMLLAGAGRLAELDRLIAAASAHAAASKEANTAMTRDVGLPLLRGLAAFAREDPDAAIGALAPLPAIARAIGGSHAQRDVIDQTLLAAAVARAHPIGRELLAKRRRLKPHTPLTAHWAERWSRSAGGV